MEGVQSPVDRLVGTEEVFEFPEVQVVDLAVCGFRIVGFLDRHPLRNLFEGDFAEGGRRDEGRTIRNGEPENAMHAKSSRLKVVPEHIQVREGEALDEGRLAPFLRDRLEGADAPMTVRQFAGGHANLTYLIRFGEAEFVLRRPPKGTKAASSHDMGREYKVLSVLYKAFPLAPRAYLYCEDIDVIGAPFFIMERRRGTVVRSVIPEEYGGGEDVVVNRRLSETLVDSLAAFHAVDYRAVGLEGIGKPEGFMKRQVEGWTQRYRKAQTKEIDRIEDLTAWLADKRPESSASTLVHNDWRLDNIMLDPDDPGRVTAVFDWDMCTLGDPLADVGTLMSLWLEEGESFGQETIMPSNVPGFMTRSEAVGRYAAKSGRDMNGMPFYRVFGLFKMAVIAQQIYYRYHKGETADKRFRHFGMAAEFLIMMAWGEAQSSGL